MTDVEQIDIATTSDDILESIHDLLVIAEAEDLPDGEPMPLAQRLAYWRNPHDHSRILRWVIRDGDRTIAFSDSWVHREQNLENGMGWVFVHPDHRSKGLARPVAKPMLDSLEEDDRVRFATFARVGSPDEAILERAGLKLAYQEKRSRLNLNNLDWELMDDWIRRASERANEYELILVEYPVAQDLVQKVCDLFLIMNTAPREDYEEEDHVMTPDMLRDIEVKQTAQGRTMLTYVAAHRTSGQWAGFTTVAYQSLEPHLAWQWDTGVHPDHRNMGLGRWLKGQMIKKLHHDHPDVRMIDTENAGSNEPMLNINVEMGFKPILVTNYWQGSLATLRERLQA